MGHWPKGKPKTLIFKKKKTELGFGDDFLGKATKAWFMKEKKVEKLNFTKIWKSALQKTVLRKWRTSPDCKKTAVHVSDKGRAKAKVLTFAPWNIYS